MRSNQLCKGESGMKEIYTAPEMEIIAFVSADVITASGEAETDLI